jgi:hypothetical protein
VLRVLWPSSSKPANCKDKHQSMQMMKLGTLMMDTVYDKEQ